MRFFPPKKPAEMGWQPGQTPSSIKAELEMVSAQIAGLEADILRTFGPSQTDEQKGFIMAWGAFTKAWGAFLESDPSTLWGSNYATALKFEERLAGFYDRFVALGGRPSIARPSTGEDWFQTAKPLIYVGLGVAALFALSAIIGNVTKTGLLDREKTP